MSDDLQRLKISLHQKDYKIRELEGLILKDPLTGLLNRRGFFDYVGKFFSDIRAAAGRTARKNFAIRGLPILFFDIDNFKKINDSYGHEAGDKILQFASAPIAEKVRSVDVVARFGGEEIVVVLLGARKKDGGAKAEEIRKAIKSRVKLPSHPELTVTVSVGVAEYTGGDSLEALVKRADEAMYAAKTSGKDRVLNASEM